MSANIYTPAGSARTELPVCIEQTADGSEYITAGKYLKPEYATYIDAVLSVPMEINPYVSEGGLFCSDLCRQYDRLTVNRKGQAVWPTVDGRLVVCGVRLREDSRDF